MDTIAIQPRRENRPSLRFFAADGEPTAARITATDYNPSSGFDSAPIVPLSTWLADAVKVGAVRPVTPGSTDNAEWEVDTDLGTILATPGDWIATNYKGRLMVLREASGPIVGKRRFPDPD